MKFASDRQRRAIFASMGKNKFSRGFFAECKKGSNRFAAKSHRRDEFERELLNYDKKYLPPILQDNTSKHVSIEEMIRQNPVIIEGYTGADLVTYPGWGVEPHVHFGDDEAANRDTYILAGKDYKASDIPRSDVKDEKLIDDAARWLAKEFAVMDRRYGYPVYARKPEIYTREVKDAANLLEEIIETDGFPAGENFLASMTKMNDRNVRAWAERNIELLQSKGLYKKIVEDVKDAGPSGGESTLLDKAYVPTDLAEAIALDTRRMKDIDKGSLDKSGSKEWKGTEDNINFGDDSYYDSQWFDNRMKRMPQDVIELPGEISKDV